MTFDLAGLPPTPEEVAAFVDDDRPDAYERLVDRLLASPRYGERWGRHWLDLARYADSDGYEGDRDRKTAYRYRDFVIRALNADMPFDQFVRWQLAGDECEPDHPSAVVATGFCTAAPCQETTPADTEENKAKIRHDELDNMLATTGSALLGLTIGCARCHDHKFDPIPTRDYYRMLAAFQTQRAPGGPAFAAAPRPRALAPQPAPALSRGPDDRAGPYRNREVLASPAGALLRPGSNRPLQEVWQAARPHPRTASKVDERLRAGDAGTARGRFLGFMAMAPLALTSTAGWIRRLGGRRWQMLHRLVYVSACAGVVHYYWLVKSDVWKPLLYGAIVLALLGERVFTSLRKPAAGGVPGARVAVLK